MLKCNYCKKELGKELNTIETSKYFTILYGKDGTMEMRFVCKKCKKYYKTIEQI